MRSDLVRPVNCLHHISGRLGLDNRLLHLHHPHPDDPHHLGDDLPPAETFGEDGQDGEEDLAEEERVPQADDCDHGNSHCRLEREQSLIGTD